MIRMVRGGEIVAISVKLKDLVRDATIGMTDAEVIGKTGLSFATYRRTRQGFVPSDDKLIQFANGLGLVAEPFLSAAKEVRPGLNADELLREAVKHTKLNNSRRLQLMQFYRELLEEQEEQEKSIEENTAA